MRVKLIVVGGGGYFCTYFRGKQLFIEIHNIPFGVSRCVCAVVWIIVIA